MNKRSRINLVLFGAIILMSVILCTALLSACEKEPLQAELSSISIPGYEGLTLEADKWKQKISLENPSQNHCYFQITLCLSDGTELWKSELIKPGKESKPIRLTQTLPAGTYPNAVLKYACFRMDKEKTPLNGAEIQITLWVK